MEVIILAGGEGRRLRPLTRERPKIQLTVGAKTVFELLLETIMPLEPERVHLCLGYNAESMIRFIHSRNWPVSISCQVETEPLGTAGALQFAKCQGYWRKQALVMNGDLLTVLNFSELLNKVHEGPVIGLMSAADSEDRLDYGRVDWDQKTGRVTGFFEKTAVNELGMINSGLYFLSPADFLGFPVKGNLSLEKDVFPNLAQRGRLLGVEVHPCFWVDMGVPRRWLAGQALVVTKGFGLNEAPRIEEGVHIEEGVVLGKGCRLYPPVLIRKGSRVGDCSVIGPNVVLDESCLVGKEVVLSQLYLGRESRIGQRSRISYSLVDQRSVFGDEVFLEGFCIAAGSRIGSESNSWRQEG